MKSVLIATTNKDKYKTVSRIFQRTIFPEDKFIIKGLEKDMVIPDEKEVGNNVERARQKAISAYKSLKQYNFDYIVGLDDAIIIKGKVEPNIKEYLNKILFENYLDNDEEFAFERAYCIIDKNENTYETNIRIPYIYKNLKNNFKIEDHTYPLSRVSYPIGYNIPICELNDNEEMDYYLKYVKDKLMDLDIKNKF